MNKLKQAIIIIGLIILVNPAYAMTPFLIKRIEVVGLQRFELGAVYSDIPVKVGDTLTDKLADDIIQNLYKTGFFKDVRLEQKDSNTLIIEVQERPVISGLVINGDHEFDHDRLVQSLKDNGLSDGKIFDQSILEQAVLGLKSEYYNHGLYSVSIDAKAIPLERNRVSVTFTINEGSPAKIKSILFIGNKTFSQRTLLNQIYLTTGNILSWWYKDNQYSSDKLNGDLEAVRSYYLNRGYINFRINSVQVQLTPNKKSVYITINVYEGKQYRIKNVKVAGDSKNVPMASLQDMVKDIKPGSVVNQDHLNKSIENIKNKLGDYGYAFATVNPVPEVDNKASQVSYTFFIDTGKKIYVRQINISGNDKTRDTVIRRELRQQENSLYNASQIQRSKDRLNLLGYFKTTDVTTTPVPGANDEVDMAVKVEETNTGSVNFGVGYAQGQGLLLNGSLSQSNLFGSGKSASLNASTSLINQSIGLSFTDPYALANGTSLGYDIYDNNYTPNNAGISPYTTQTIGGKVRTGIPVSEFDKINFSLGFENNQIGFTSDFVPLRFIEFTNDFGNSVNEVPFSIGWVRNTTDSSLWPTKGALFSEVGDMTLPGVGAQYYRFTSTNTWFTPINDDFTLKTNGTFGTINPYGDSAIVPFYQNFYAGGITSIRGYYISSLGPKDTDGSSLGGTNEAILTNELLFPMPGVKEEKSVRLSLFYDMGALWGGSSFGLTPQQSFRASYGVGVTWISPLGPIKVVYALPLFNQPNDNLQPIQFMLGSSF